MKFSTLNVSNSRRVQVAAFLNSYAWRGTDARLTHHASDLVKAGLDNETISEPCAKCLEAVSDLGVPEAALPALASAYEIFLKTTDAPDAEEVFPSSLAWGTGSPEPDHAAASAALENILGRFQQTGLTANAWQEMLSLFESVTMSRYFNNDPVIARLGDWRSIKLGDLLRISLFVAMARTLGVDASDTKEVREHAIEALGY